MKAFSTGLRYVLLELTTNAVVIPVNLITASHIGNSICASLAAWASEMVIYYPLAVLSVCIAGYFANGGRWRFL